MQMRQPALATSLLVGLTGASAVVLGAFGAHALRDVLDARGTELWHTAVSYHFWHALALVLAVMAGAGRARRVALAAFAIGILIFCGSLYALALGRRGGSARSRRWAAWPSSSAGSRWGSRWPLGPVATRTDQARSMRAA